MRASRRFRVEHLRKTLCETSFFFVDDFGVKQQQRSCLFFLSFFFFSSYRAGRRRDLRVVVVVDRSIDLVENARLEDVRNDGYEYALSLSLSVSLSLSLSLSLFSAFFVPLSVLNNLIKIDVFKTTNKKKARCNKLTSLDVRDDDSPQNQGNFGMLQRER